MSRSCSGSVLRSPDLTRRYSQERFAKKKLPRISWVAYQSRLLGRMLVSS